MMVLSENEIRGSESGQLSRVVADILRMFRGSAEPSLEVVNRVVCDAALQISQGHTPDLFRVTRHPALGATYHLTAAFLPNKFRNLVTSAAYERLATLGHHPTIDDQSTLVNVYL